MTKGREITNIQNNMSGRLQAALLQTALLPVLILTFVLTLILILIVMLSASADAAYAADKDTGGDKPIREVHQVDIDGTEYCFFVTHNVVLTPEEIAGMTDEELSDEIIARSGLFMKKTNCRKPSHKIILPANWSSSDRIIYLSDSDIEDIRGAVPEEGFPVKLHMDLKIADGARPETGDKREDRDESRDGDENRDEAFDGGGSDDGGDTDGDSKDDGGGKKEDDADNVYSTYRKLSPRIIFIAVVTEADAAYGEEVCTWEDKPSKLPDGKNNGSGGSGKDKKDMLPEFRTIAMPDRSGGPLEDTLKDGNPVTLEWVEPAKHMEDVEPSSLLDRIPGGAAGLAVLILLLAAAAGVAAYAAVKHRRE